MYIVIAGGGKVGYYLAKRLYDDKHAVALIEKNKRICDEIVKTLDILVINGDACDPKYLEEAGINRADVVAAVSGADDNNLVICQLAKQKFGVKRTVARVNDPENETTFSKLGVDVPIHSTAIIARIIEEETSLADFVNLMTFRRGKLALVRVDLAEDSPVVNKHLSEIKLPEDSVLVSIVRGNEVIIPRGETILLPQDDIIAITKIENEHELLDYLLGKI